MKTSPASGNKTPASKTAPRKAAAKKRTSPLGAAKPAPARKSTGRTSTAKTPAGTGADSPILPVDQLEALHKIKPGAVDWIIEQTQAEAEHRRTEAERVNNLIFVEHLFAQASALVIGVAGIWGGVWLAQNGQPWVGFAITAAVMAALAIMQLSARTKRQ